MKKVRITAVRQSVYPDLMARFENPIEHTCDVRECQQWISTDGKCPDGLCPSAWQSMRPFVESLSQGKGNFFDGWMQIGLCGRMARRCEDGTKTLYAS